MGYTQEEFKITVLLSRHNSDQDKTDDFLWDELRERVRLICMEHRYESIKPTELYV